MRRRRRAREGQEKGKRKQATNFEGAVCCPSAVVQRAAKQKKSRGEPGVTGTLGKANSHFDPTQTGPGIASPR